MRKGGDNQKSRYRRYLRAEQEAVALYSAMAEADPHPLRARVFRELAEGERRHVEYWAGKLGLSAAQIPDLRSTLRVRLLGWLARRFGPMRVLPLVMRIEGEDTAMYSGDPEAVQVVADGEGHAQTLQGLKEGRYPGGDLDPGGWHRAVAGGTFRAGVLGGNDGLVSNFGLVWGVAGGTSDPAIILLAGVAGLLAGAFSMAAGEYVSMRANRDLAEFRIEKERRELEEAPEEERQEMVLIYKLKGMTQEEAEHLADRIMQDREVALQTMVREELGLNPMELGSPWGAAASSFALFALGAAIPVLPYALGVGPWAFWLSGGVSALALLAAGSMLALLSGKNALASGLRLLLIGSAAALVTFGIGNLVGVALA